VRGNELKHQLVGRQITLLGDPLDDGFILEIVVVIMIDSHIEKPVRPEPERLVNLEIKTYRSHKFIFSVSKNLNHFNSLQLLLSNAQMVQFTILL
jgi:hypothetical protein